MAKDKPYRFFLYLLLELSWRIACWLPRSVCYALAGGVARGLHWLLPDDRAKTRRYLRVAFQNEKSEVEIREIAENVFVHLAHSAVDVFRFPLLTRECVRQLVDVPDGTRSLDVVLERGRGAIALTGHIGNWELLASYFRFLGYPGSLVGRRIYYEPFNRVLEQLRKKGLVTTIYRDSSARLILAELRRNGVVGMSADQDIDSLEGVFIPFFGRDTWTPSGPAKIAMASGAAIVPAFMIHEGNRYRLHLEDPIWPHDYEPMAEGVREMTKAWSQVVERMVRRYPDQWVWMHNRWKTTPEKVEGNYAKRL